MNDIAYSRISIIPAVAALILSAAFNANASSYAGPIARLWAGTTTSLSSGFSTGGPAWITPVSSPDTWVAMTKPFIGVGSALKAADFGSAPNQNVFLTTSPGSQGFENMDSINIQDTRLDTPSDQIKSLTIWNTGNSAVVTAVMGQQPGGSPALRLLNSTMTGVAASSVIGRKPVDMVTGTVLIYNHSTNSFDAVNDAVIEITAR